MNDMDEMTFCSNFLTAAEVANMEPKGVTVQSGIGAYAWDSGDWYPVGGTRLDTDELARRVADELKGQLDTIVRPEIEGKYKLKHR